MHLGFVEALAALAPVGEHLGEQGVEAFAVVMLDEVAKLVDNYIVNEGFIYLDQFEVEGDNAVGATTAPTGLHAANRQVWYWDGMLLEAG